MVSFLLHAGLRFQESLSLGLGDVQLSERKGSLLVRHGKGNKEQEIPSNAEARRSSYSWLNVCPETKSQNLWAIVENVTRYGQEARL